MNPDQFAVLVNRLNFAVDSQAWTAPVHYFGVNVIMPVREIRAVVQTLTDLQAENIASMQTIAELRAENERLREKVAEIVRDAIYDFSSKQNLRFSDRVI